MAPARLIMMSWAQSRANGFRVLRCTAAEHAATARREADRLACNAWNSACSPTAARRRHHWPAKTSCWLTITRLNTHKRLTDRVGPDCCFGEHLDEGIRNLIVADDHQPCASCGSARRRIFSEPIARQYDLQSLLCPNCLTTVRMVCKRPSKKKAGSSVRYAPARN
jgi:hypothetical protein